MKCKYCGKPSGFFKSKHKECEEKHDKAIEELKTLYKKEITYGLSSPDDVKPQADGIKSTGYVSENENENLIKV